ncbi:hypothetical protein [Nitratireductor sp. L15S-10]|uniref:hypothetical protein n=1 Tax=Nitratireductor sp. L15S-10 TaxID=3034028 RepID=UPI003857E26D
MTARRKYTQFYLHLCFIDVSKIANIVILIKEFIMNTSIKNRNDIRSPYSYGGGGSSFGAIATGGGFGLALGSPIGAAFGTAGGALAGGIAGGVLGSIVPIVGTFGGAATGTGLGATIGAAVGTAAGAALGALAGGTAGAITARL